MSIRSYLVGKGPYAGMYHVREYVKGKYKHIGRFHDPEEVARIINGHITQEEYKVVNPIGKNIVFIKKIENEQTESGILLEQSKTAVTHQGIVKGVGPDVTVVKTGDVIVYDQRDTDELVVELTSYLFIKEDFVLGVIRG